MEKKLFRAKQLENLEIGEKMESLNFKLMISSALSESKIVINIPDYAKVKFLNMSFMEDSIDKIIIEKCTFEDKEEKFVIYFYIGKINICSYYFTSDLRIEYDKFRNLKFEHLTEWCESKSNPFELLELEEIK